MIVAHLIDASPYLFRAWFSLPKSIVDAQGRPQNAVYGFMQFLKRYIADEKPTHLAVAFDRHFNGSFRNDFYPPYKAQREASPKELDAQVDPCFAAVQELGIAAFIDERYEADDIIATIIDRTWKSKAHYVIVTSDKDMTQLVGDRVLVVDPARKLRFDAAAVKEKFGVNPEQMTDFLGLAGDSVDNIPGVRGVGPKTAAQLLQQFGSLEGIYENIDAVKPATLASKLREHVSMAGLSKRLATVSTEVELEVTMDSMKLR